MLLRNIVCKDGLLVNPTKIALILSFPPSTNVKILRETLGNTRYYHKFIKGYDVTTFPMEKLLKKDAAYEWTQECQGSFDTLKAKMVLHPYWFFLIGIRSSMCMSTLLISSWGVFLCNRVRANWITQSHMPVEICHLVNEIIQQWKGKAWRWFMHCKSSGTICWVDISRCSLIIMLCNTLLIILCWGGRSLDGCYSSRSLILK